VLLTEFDKLKRAYQEHQNEIHAKLVNIMGDVLTNYIKSLQEVRWDLPQEIAGPNEYIQGLVKQTVTLYKVLHKFLGSTTTEVCGILCNSDVPHSDHVCKSFCVANHVRGLCDDQPSTG